MHKNKRHNKNPELIVKVGSEEFQRNNLQFTLKKTQNFTPNLIHITEYKVIIS